MLQKIRHTTNTIAFRILLGLIVISFSIWGISDVFKGPSNKEIATFSEIDPVTYAEFVKMRALKIRQIQQNSDMPISEEQISSMGLDEYVIQTLVTNKLLEFLASKFDLDFSDNVLADFVRSIPMFRNEQNEFDINKFKSFLLSQNITEDAYSDEVRNALSKDIVMSSLIGNAYIPNVRIDNIINHMSEIRKIDIGSISLKPQDKELVGKDFKQEDLQNFYKENGDLFKTQEVRDICYSKIDSASARSQINITEDDIKNYWKSNNSEFSGKKFDQVKSEIKTKLQNDAFDSWIVDLSKELVDEVAGGATLKEIASKYNLKRICEKNINSENVESRANGLFAGFIEQISEMSDKQVSYPLDLQTEKGQVLFEIDRLVPEQIKPFDDIKNKVMQEYGLYLYKQDVIKKLQDFTNTTGEAAFISDAQKIGVNVTKSKDYIRANLSQNVTFPPEMLVSIFASEVNKVMGPFVTDDSAYVFVVRSVGYDKNMRSKILKESSESIAGKLREGMFEELISYAQILSKMKLNKNVELNKMSKGQE